MTGREERLDADSISNDVLACIHNRRSIRSFADLPIEFPDLQTILEAANQAPSAHNRQSWRFVVLQGTEKSRLGALVADRAGDFARPSSVLLRMASRSIVSAAVVVAVVNTGDLIEHATSLSGLGQDAAKDFFRTMEIQSSAAAVENLLLAATSLGIGSVWLGALFLIKHEVLELLGEPTGEFMAVVALGYPARVPRGPKKRRLRSVTRYLG